MDVSFDFRKWSSENTYDSNYKAIPETSGVYVIIDYNLENHTYDILYIGSAKNLSIRLKSHEVRRMISHYHDYTPVSFLECANYREVEKHLIKKYHPKYNFQHNG